MKIGNREFKNQKLGTVKRFHQFVRIERGPVNAAIIDLLTGTIFQVPKAVVDKFEAGSHRDIREFLEVVQKEKLVIEIDPLRWIPANDTELDESKKENQDIGLELHIEESVNLNEILQAFRRYPVYKIYYYGVEVPPDLNTNLEVELKEKNFGRCVELADVTGNFGKSPEPIVCFNMRYNSCWGAAIAITSDGKIRPCIHSLIEIGTIEQDLDDIDSLLERMLPYWEYTKDKVERCRDCEFRYVCFDCREIAMRKNGEIDDPNPSCNYNPYTGDWEDET